MLTNADEVLKQWISVEIHDEIKALLKGQLWVVIAHSVGVGLIMLSSRRISNADDARRVLRGYCLLSMLVIGNAIYGLLFATAPPMAVLAIYVAGFFLALFGAFRSEAESA